MFIGEVIDFANIRIIPESSNFFRLFFQDIFSLILGGFRFSAYICRRIAIDAKIMEENKGTKRESPSGVAAEPAGLYFGASQQLRDSGIIPELRNLGKEDTVWLIRFMEQHLEELSFVNDDALSLPDPLVALDQLSGLVRCTGKTSEQLIDEYLKEKYVL